MPKNIVFENKIPVKLIITTNQDNWNNSGFSMLKDDIIDILNNNNVFIEDPTSKIILKIDVVHIYESTVPSIGSAVVAGATLGILPSIINRDTIINIQLNSMKLKYRGTRIMSTVAPNMNEFKEGYSNELLEHLVENALNQFILKHSEQLRSISLEEPVK